LRNPYFISNFTSKLIIFSTIICVILSTIFDDFYLNILAFSGILTFGIIHGANDLLLIKEVSKNYNFKLQFLYYVIMVGGFFLFFYNIPILALMTFVLLSSYHFGEHQWTLFGKTEDYLIKPFYFFYGLTIFSLIFYFNLEEVAEVIYDIATVQLSENFFLYLLISSFILSIIISLFIYKKIKNQFITQFILLILLILTFKTCSLIWSFAIYLFFGTVSHLLRNKQYLFLEKLKKNQLKIILKKHFYIGYFQ